MTAAPEEAALDRIDAQLLQLILDGGQARVRQAADLSRMTGIALSAPALLVIERLATKAVRVTELGELVGVTSPTITRQVQDLERKGLIDRSADEQDGRAAIVRLSAEGLRVWQELLDLRRRTIRHVVQDWEQQELEQLEPFLERMVDGLRRAT